MTLILKQSTLLASLLLLNTLSLAQPNVGGGWHGGARHAHPHYEQIRDPWRGSGAVLPLGDLLDTSCQPSKICNMFGQCRIYQICE